MVVALIQVLMLPLLLLNLVAIAVALVWLAILFQWTTIGIGIALLVTATFGISIALLPHRALAARAATLREKGYRGLSFLLAALELMYVYGVTTVWCGGVLWYSMERVGAPSLLLPTLLWSYAVATGPFAYTAHKEDSLGSAFTLFFTQAAYITMGLMILLGHPSFYDVMEVFIGFMIVAAVLTLKFAGTAGRQSAATT